MTQITVIEPNGHPVTLEVLDGSSLMQAALSAGMAGIIGECGGAAMCATCHVYVEPDWIARLPEIQDNEDEMLDCVSSERQAGSRLGCQIKITPELAGLTVRLPATQF